MSVSLQDTLGPRTTRISVLVSSAEAQEISHRAEAANLSVSAFLRTQALTTDASANDQEALAAFNRVIDHITHRIDQANTSLETALARLTPAP
jgi:hypothetical protein